MDDLGTRTTAWSRDGDARPRLAAKARLMKAPQSIKRIRTTAL
jgi:hypothetical protein